MTSLINNSLISPSTYNALPHISQACHVPTSAASDLSYLRSLLLKHNVPSHIVIRLVHKHFDCKPDEVMTIRNLDIPTHGQITVMRPATTTAETVWFGIHYYVDSNGELRAYEYTDTHPTPISVSDLEPFLAEFCKAVTERGLQHKLGLKICRSSSSSIDSGINGDKGQEAGAWTEYEFHADRSTILIPCGRPTPPDPDEEDCISVNTEFAALSGGDDWAKCIHGNCRHCRRHDVESSMESDEEVSAEDEDGELYVSGLKIEPGTEFHAFFQAVVRVW